MALSGSALAITYGTVHRFLPRLLVPVYSTLNLHGTFHDRPFSVWKPSLCGSTPVGRLSMDHLSNPGRTLHYDTGSSRIGGPTDCGTTTHHLNLGCVRCLVFLMDHADRN